MIQAERVLRLGAPSRIRTYDLQLRRLTRSYRMSAAIR